jgi:hypothetical protein
LWYPLLPLSTTTGCNFTSNVAISTDGEAQGGGLRVSFASASDASDSTVEIRDCRVDGNQLTSSFGSYGGGMNIDYYFGIATRARLAVEGTAARSTCVWFGSLWWCSVQ